MWIIKGQWVYLSLKKRNLGHGAYTPYSCYFLHLLTPARVQPNMPVSSSKYINLFLRINTSNFWIFGIWINYIYLQDGVYLDSSHQSVCVGCDLKASRRLRLALNGKVSIAWWSELQVLVMHGRKGLLYRGLHVSAATWHTCTSRSRPRWLERTRTHTLKGNSIPIPWSVDGATHHKRFFRGFPVDVLPS